MSFSKRSRYLPLVLLVLLLVASFPAVFALFHKGFFVTDDGEWMIIRLSQFYSALRFGEFPVRYLGEANNGYGYPLPDFLYPGFLYLGSFIHILRFGFINTIKIEILLFIISSGLFTFLWLRYFFSQLAAFVGALVFVYSPYHLYDAYVRGSVGELMSLAVVPFVLWQIERKSTLWTALGIGILLLAHNILAVLFLPFLFLYSLLRHRRFTILPFGLGLLLAAFFWIPALYDLQYTVFLQTKISDWQQYFASLSQIGMVSIIVLLFSAFSLLTIKTKKTRSLVVFFFCLGLISLFLSTEISLLVWHIIPVTFVQFPFRFLSLGIVSIAFLAAYSVGVFKKLSYGIALALLVLTIYSAYPYIMPKQFFQKDDMYYATNQSTTTVKNEYMPKWVKVVPLERPKEKVQLVSGEGLISNVESIPNKISYNVSFASPAIIQTNAIYFPGWNAQVDGKPAVISYNNQYGVMQIPENVGNHAVMFTFSETPVRLLSDVISVLALVALLFVVSKDKLFTSPF